MNTRLMMDVAAVIEALPMRGDHMPDASWPPSFDMRYAATPCGTPQCIAGWTCWVAKETAVLTGSGPTAMGTAARLLGLDDRMAAALFAPIDALADFRADPNLMDGTPNPEFISPTRAASVLRGLAATGVVDWTIGHEGTT